MSDSENRVHWKRSLERKKLVPINDTGIETAFKMERLIIRLVCSSKYPKLYDIALSMCSRLLSVRL